VLPFLIASGAIFMSESATGQTGVKISPSASCNGLMHVPVVMKETSGYGFAGPLHLRFSVYSNGLVSSSSMTLSPANSEAQFVMIPVRAAKQLAADLAAAGAHNLCDQKMNAVDLPPTTVTTFVGRGDAKAHTFSYWYPTGQHAVVQQILTDFENTWLSNS